MNPIANDDREPMLTWDLHPGHGLGAIRLGDVAQPWIARLGLALEDNLFTQVTETFGANPSRDALLDAERSFSALDGTLKLGVDSDGRIFSITTTCCWWMGSNLVGLSRAEAQELIGVRGGIEDLVFGWSWQHDELGLLIWLNELNVVEWLTIFELG